MINPRTTGVDVSPFALFVFCGVFTAAAAAKRDEESHAVHMPLCLSAILIAGVPFRMRR